MAKQTVTTLIDDIDGSEATETVQFSFRGTSYSIDLNDKHAAAFDKAVAKYVEHATKEPRRRTAAGAAAGSRGSGSGRRTDLAEVRAWATDNGYEVSGRGRVAAEILDAYDGAQ